MHTKDSRNNEIPDQVDVLIVGAGIMGAIVAAQVRELQPTASILLVDAGPPLGSALGHHLHDTPDSEARGDFAARANRANQEKYMSSVDRSASDILASVPAGMHALADFGHDSAAMPGASIGWNLGGMSVHWAAATPTPFDTEVPAEIESSEWNRDCAIAQRLLRVHPGPYPHDPVGDAVLAVVDDVFGPTSAPGRHPQPMPVAMKPQSGGTLGRIGPSAVFPPIESGGDAAFFLRHSSIVRRILIEDGHAVGVEVWNIDGSAREEFRARVVVVCADTLRTPQLLFASGVGGPAVGHYLNEHAFLAGTVLVDLDRLGVSSTPPHLDGEWFTSASWLPHSGEAQPFQAQIMQTPIANPDGGPDGYAATLALYVPTEVSVENRIEFSDGETDITGLPRMTIHFSYSSSDRASIDRAIEVQARVAERLGAFDPEQTSRLLPPGSSLHYTGTARLGARNDGTSVCDSDGRVWGVEGLLVAGNAVIPTALAANSTLAGAVTAVRAGRAAAAACNVSGK